MVNAAMSLSDALNRTLHRGTVLLYNNSLSGAERGFLCRHIYFMQSRAKKRCFGSG